MMPKIRGFSPKIIGVQPKYYHKFAVKSYEIDKSFDLTRKKSPNKSKDFVKENLNVS